jgi:hypothetical protein
MAELVGTGNLFELSNGGITLPSTVDFGAGAYFPLNQ